MPDRAAFIAQMMPYAQRWSAQTGIPPEVFIAIMGSESNFGAAGSLFGIKGTGTAGSANYATHEVYGGQTVNINDQFAIYNNPDEAFQHFIGLISSGRYAPAWQQFQSTGDWQGLLQGINAAGYATNPSWHSMIAGMASDISGQAIPGGGGTATASTGYPSSSVMGPNGRTVGQITGTDYLSPQERAFYLSQIGREDLLSPGELAMVATMNQTPGQAPAQTPSGGGGMNREQLAQQMYGRSYSQLTVREQIAVDDAFTAQAPAAGTPSAGLTATFVSPLDGQPHVYQFNTQTGRYDIDLGLYRPIEGPGAGTTPQGGLNEQQLIQGGAINIAPGVYDFKGIIYEIQGDGTYKPTSIPDVAEDQAILSSAGLAGLFGDQPSSNLSQSLAAEGPTPTAGAPGGQVSASTNPMNNLFTQHQIAQAVSREGTEPGDVLGVAQPMFTGLSGPVPITFGGIYEGGGMTPVRGAAGAGVPEFSGYMPPTTDTPWRTSVGFGMGRTMSPDASMPRGPTFDPNYAAYADMDPALQPDARLELMALRQLAADKGLIMPNLATIKNEEARGLAQPGAYKAALASLSKAIGTPLSVMDIAAIPDPAPYRQTIQQGTKVGSRTYTPERYAELFGTPGRSSGRPINFQHGGSLTANRPMWVIDPATGQQVASFAENGPETVQFGGEQPTGERMPTRDQLLAERQPDLYYYDPMAAPMYGRGGGGTAPSYANAQPFNWRESDPLYALRQPEFSGPEYDYLFRPDRAGTPNIAPRRAFHEPQNQWVIAQAQQQQAREAAARGRAGYQEREAKANEEFFGKQPLDFGRPTVEEMQQPMGWQRAPRRLNPAQIVQAMRT